MENKHKVLIVASVASMIDQFNIPNIDILLSLGYEVDVATNFLRGSTCSDEKIKSLLNLLDLKGVDCYQVDFDRNITNIKSISKSIKQIDKIVLGKSETINSNRHNSNSEYLFIHSHSPIGGVIARIIARKHHLKNIYTAHGFHFFTGAPLKNWILYYPVERFLSHFTDVLITINQEDFNRAKSHFHAKETIYIPGIGVDTKKFCKCAVSKDQKRNELGIPSNTFVLLSVGELQKRKNQQLILEALKKIQNDKIIYLCVGKGEEEDNYKKFVDDNKLINVRFLGFRSDINELCIAADCFVHPSIREGLGIAPLEAMASGLPLISSYINGIRDYTSNRVTGFCIDPNSIDEMIDAINNMYLDESFRKECGENNKKIVKKFDLENTNAIMYELYKKMGEKK